MSNTYNFISAFSNEAFDEHPFCNGDAFLLCEVFYMPFEKVVSASFDDAPIEFDVAASRLFDSRDNRHQKLGVVLFSHLPSRDMMKIVTSHRYLGTKIAAVQTSFSRSPAVQFAAATFILPDGTIVVNYRGTDDTISGWKEDFDIFLTHGTPSQTLAIQYLEDAAKAFEGDIIVIGHSKGGNLALCSALSCSDETRARIKEVYNNDGPGFYDRSFLDSDAYKELKPKYRHYIPSGSIIGMCMAHDYDYTVVKTYPVPMPLKHYIGYWRMKDGEALLLKDRSKASKLFDLWAAWQVARAEDGFLVEVEDVFDKVSLGFGANTLTEFVKKPVSSIHGGISAWKALPKETRSKFFEAFDGGLHFINHAIRNLNSIDAEGYAIEAFAKSTAEAKARAAEEKAE